MLIKTDVNDRYTKTKNKTKKFTVLHCVSIKSSPFLFFCDHFPSCKPIQIINGRNIAGKIWNKWHMAVLTIVRYVALVYIAKWHPFFYQFRNVKIIMSHFIQFFRWWYCHRSCFLQSVNHKCHWFHVIYDKPAFLVNLLTYLFIHRVTERALLGSRRRFWCQ